MKDTFEATNRGDRTTILGFAEALHDIEGRFNLSSDLTQIDILGGHRKSNSSRFAAKCFYVAKFSEVMDHFDEMVSRDAVGFGHLSDRSGPFVSPQKNERPHGIVGVTCELHGLFFQLS